MLRYTYIAPLGTFMFRTNLQGGSNMTGTNCDLFTHNQSRSYLNHLEYLIIESVVTAQLLGPWSDEMKAVPGLSLFFIRPDNYWDSSPQSAPRRLFTPS
jgi:hypothetical protein